MKNRQNRFYIGL